MDAAPSRRLCG